MKKRDMCMEKTVKQHLRKGKIGVLWKLASTLWLSEIYKDIEALYGDVI